MKKLSDKTYWDSIYQDMPERTTRHSFSAIFKEKLKRLTRDHSNFVIWEVLAKKYLPHNPSYKVLEVGCAPGKYLMHFNTSYGYKPYGVEYSEKGVQLTKENFVKAGLDTSTILFADFFDTEFQEKNREQYNVVFSRGFIEHFDNVKEVVDLHANLLMSGGTLMVMIPNLSGINKILAKYLNKKSYDLHNISIMNKESFNNLFPDKEFKKMYCDYVGLFSIGLFNTDAVWKYRLYRVLLVLQRPVDFFLRVLFKSYSSHFASTSPYLLCIAQKK
ncbi:MAG: methyltransferase domain-containing protein [Candidatus Zambryskibacteria bacterium]|nr:methyltransferase domain-containing protein [Candidatus Zambryskibacteria bacterium]